MSIRALAFAIGLCALSHSATGFAAEAETADLFLINGKIVTVDEAFSVESCMAVKGDRILAVGPYADLRLFRGPKTRVIDLQGKTVMPGLIDSHGHPVNACMTEFDHPIPHMESIADVLEYIESRAETLEDGEWIWVSQVFLTRLREERYPTRAELDAAAPNNPTVFRTGPDASVNSRVMELMGLDKDWDVDDGGPGYAEKDPETGEPTGILRSCTRYIPYKSSTRKPTREEHAERLRELFADYNRVGVTGVGERAAGWDEIELYAHMNENGMLTVRPHLALHVDTIQPVEQIVEEIEKVAASELYPSKGMIDFRTVKTFMDGGMLTGSAYMNEPWGVSEFYNISDPEYRGVRFIPDEKLLPTIEACMSRDVQFIAHCVGDGAVRAFVDGFIQLSGRFDVRGQRPVICHSNFMSAESVRLAAEYGICHDIQPAWLYLDARTLLNQFGYERMTWFQPLKSIFARGGMAGGGSDHMQKIGSMRSINFYDPWMGMWVAMTRRAKWVDDPVHPEQALSRVEAIRFYTINNAYLFEDEENRGSLEPGKLADFVILADDILTCPVDRVKDMKVLATYLGGRKVHESN